MARDEGAGHPTGSDNPNLPFENAERGAPEVAWRGAQRSFVFGFFSDDAQTVPIMPGDPSTYPRVQIVQPDGTIFLTASPPSVHPASSPGFWQFDFSVPQDAKVTGVGEFWQFAAEIINAAGRHNVYRTAFVVKDPSVIKVGEQARFYAVIRGRSPRIMYKTLVPLYNITLDILRSGSEDDYIVHGATVGTQPSDIKHIVSNGIHVYQYDVRATKTPNVTLQNLEEGIWQIHWGAQESPLEPEELIFQHLEVHANKILEFTKDVIYIIDKLNKRADSKQSYGPHDVIEALVNGLQFVNSVMPSTSYTFLNIPNPLRPYLFLAAAYWAYLGQLGLAVDLQFNFSGQSTVLDQDQTSGIEGMLSRYQSMLWEQMRAVKTDVLRHQRPTGTVGVRPRRARFLSNTVFRISSQGSAQELAMFLTGLGLI